MGAFGAGNPTPHETGFDDADREQYGETPKTLRSCMMATWGPVHADGPCVIADPRVLDAMLEALKIAELRLRVEANSHSGSFDSHDEAMRVRSVTVASQCHDAIAQAEGRHPDPAGNRARYESLLRETAGQKLGATPP